jgi:Methyltransferase domain
MKITAEKMYKLLNEQNSLQRYITRTGLFDFFERFGFHIVSDHFYEPIPNLRQLNSKYSDTEASLPFGVTLDFEEVEKKHIERIIKYGHEFERNVTEAGYCMGNPYFRPFDAVNLYCFLRDMKITKVVEVGQGFSTLVLLAALKRNGLENGKEIQFVSIDPFERISSQDNTQFAIEVSVYKKQVQDMNSAEFLSLIDENTLLFVDSSHIFKPGSDVEYLMRRIYPMMPLGSFLHIHDIYTPYPWPLENYTKKKWFWNEQEHLESFLTFNSAFKIVLPVYWLFKDSKDVRRVLSSLHSDLVRPDLGTSFYLQKTACT